MTKLTQQELEKERALFEKWLSSVYGFVGGPDYLIDENRYVIRPINMRWSSWRARAELDGDRVMSDNVKNPKHYQIISGIESIDIIARSMTVEQFSGFCLGNILKYRIRAGKKDALEQDIAKANEYEKIFENKKHLCVNGR
ncbi:hypothetical protein A9G39_02560 [Gilliamella sp. Imp1-6]|nr:hypothetical protein A9G39_02560 [Gilliamella apicola]